MTNTGIVLQLKNSIGIDKITGAKRTTRSHDRSNGPGLLRPDVEVHQIPVSPSSADEPAGAELARGHELRGSDDASFPHRVQRHARGVRVASW